MRSSILGGASRCFCWNLSEPSRNWWAERLVWCQLLSSPRMLRPPKRMLAKRASCWAMRPKSRSSRASCTAGSGTSGRCWDWANRALPSHTEVGIVRFALALRLVAIGHDADSHEVRDLVQSSAQVFYELPARLNLLLEPDVGGPVHFEE